jgi:hypothetical protein
MDEPNPYSSPASSLRVPMTKVEECPSCKGQGLEQGFVVARAPLSWYPRHAGWLETFFTQGTLLTPWLIMLFGKRIRAFHCRACRATVLLP